ncbi:MAG TPA: hypothetical protein VIT91_15140 [Chthoniobacterales bacterium]
MTAYADTGFLISVHSPDANTGRAIARMDIQVFPLPWSWLHELEFRNAMRLRVFRRQIREEELYRVFGKVTLRSTSGVYQTVIPPVEESSGEAERLSAAYTETLGVRSLDLLHVAHAIILGIKEFLTFDQRRAALAKAAGLHVPEL